MEILLLQTELRQYFQMGKDASRVPAEPRNKSCFASEYAVAKQTSIILLAPGEAIQPRKKLIVMPTIDSI